MTYYLEKLYNLVYENLYLSCPVMSGNMRHHIDLNTVLKDDEEVEIVISAPFYDLNEWRKTGRIKFTGKTIGDIHDYAYWVNAIGAFGTHNKSEHWANRAIYDACCTLAAEIGAEVINELPLD